MEEQWVVHQAEWDTDGVPSLHDVAECMDLDQDLVQMVQIAVKTCLAGEPTVMVSTHLGETLSDFMTKLRNQLQIRMDQLLQVSFGCKTLKMEVSLAENGLGELDTVNLSLPLADRMQGVHISSLIRFQVEKQKDDKEMAQSSNPTSGSLVVHPHSADTVDTVDTFSTWTIGVVTQSFASSTN